MKTSALVVSILLSAQFATAQFFYGDYSVRVEVEGNGFAHFTEIYFEDGLNPPQSVPTYGWDGCCDALLNMGNEWQPHVFTQVVAPPAPTNNHRLSINGLPHVFEHTEVPLGFLPGELAEYHFTFEELWRLPAGMTVELEDNSLAVTQDLMTDSTYSTWSAVSDDEERFTLHFYPENVTSINTTTKRKARVYSDGESIVVSGLDLKQNGQVNLYDITGRTIQQHGVNVKTTRKRIPASGLSRGLYVVEIIEGKTKRQTLKISI